jgi:uncharacterized membrane protein YwaF
MHVILVIAGGFGLLGLFLLFGWLWGASTAAMALAAKAFVPVWLIIALVNMWVGVHHAGYTLREELPIMLLVFAVPALAAALAVYLLTRS